MLPSPPYHRLLTFMLAAAASLYPPPIRPKAPGRNRLSCRSQTGPRPDQVVKRIDQPPVRSNGHAEGAETGSCPAADTSEPGARADPDNPQHADGHPDNRDD